MRNWQKKRNLCDKIKFLTNAKQMFKVDPYRQFFDKNTSKIQGGVIKESVLKQDITNGQVPSYSVGDSSSKRRKLM